MGYLFENPAYAGKALIRLKDFCNERSLEWAIHHNHDHYVASIVVDGYVVSASSENLHYAIDELVTAYDEHQRGKLHQVKPVSPPAESHPIPEPVTNTPIVDVDLEPVPAEIATEIADLPKKKGGRHKKHLDGESSTKKV